MSSQLHKSNQGAYKNNALFVRALVLRSFGLPDTLRLGADTPQAVDRIIQQSLSIASPSPLCIAQWSAVRKRPSDTRLMHDSKRSLSRSRSIKKVVGMSRGRNAPTRAQIQALSRPRQPGPLHGK